MFTHLCRLNKSIELDNFCKLNLTENEKQRCENKSKCCRGEEGQPQQFLVQATLSSFSCSSHLGILVFRLLCVLKFPILEDTTIFYKFCPLKGIELNLKTFFVDKKFNISFIT